MSNNPNRKKRKSRITDEQIKKTLTKTNGIQSICAKILLIDRSVICNRIKASADLQAHCKQLIEDRIDRAEQALDNLIGEDNTTAVLFTLKTIGRSRGYIEHAPLEEVNQDGLKALGEFFSTIGKASKAAPAPKLDEPKDPDSYTEKTSRPGSNFP